MAETRNGGGGGGGRKKARKAKAKAEAAAVAAETTELSAPVTTRSAASGKKSNKAATTNFVVTSPTPKAKAKSKAKGKVKAKAPVVEEVAAVETEEPPSRKKKKRKRIHKRKGSDAGALAALAEQHDDEPQEPPAKKQNVKKVDAKETVFTTPTKAAPTDSKNRSSRGKMKGNRGGEMQEEADTEKPATRRVQLSAAVETPVSTTQRGRLTRAAAAAAAAAVTSTLVKASPSASASDQSPPSSSKTKRKRKRSRQGRRDSVKPTPAAEELEEKLTAEDVDEQKATAVNAEEKEEDDASAATLSPVKPKSTIISLVRVKSSRLASDAAPSSTTETELVMPTQGEERDIEDKEKAVKSPSPKKSPDELGHDAEQHEGEVSNPDEVAEEAETLSFDDISVADQLLDVDQDTEDEGSDKIEREHDFDGEEERKEDSDHDHNEDMEDNGSSDEPEANVASTGVDARDIATSESDLDEMVDVARDDDNGSSTEDDDEVSDPENEDQREEEALGEEEVTADKEAVEEAASDDNAYEDESAMQSAAVNFFMTQHPVQGSSGEEEIDSDIEQQQQQSDDDSESESGYPPQEATFSSDSDEEEEEEEEQFQPGVGHYRFLSPPERSTAQGSGSPEVIELSDSDFESEGSVESDAEAELPSHPAAGAAAFDSDEEEEDEAEEQEDEEIDEEKEENEDEEESRWNGELEEEYGQFDTPATAYHSDVDQETGQPGELAEANQPDENHGEDTSALAGWDQEIAAFGNREEAKSDDETEEEEEEIEVDESEDEVVVVASHHEHTEERYDDEEVLDDGHLTPLPLDAPPTQHADAMKQVSSSLLVKSDDQVEALQSVASQVADSIASDSTHREHTNEDTAKLKASDKSIPAPSASQAYTAVPSKLLLESVLAGSPRATVASLTQGTFPTTLPARSQSVTRTWGPSFGGESLDTNAPVVASSRQAEASPLSSWFFAKGPANFKKRVVMPRVKETSVYGSSTPGSPRHRVGSPRPTKKPRLDTETKEEEESSATRTDDFVQRLIDTSSWRSWYSPGDSNQLLDPPLPAAMIKRLGGEVAMAMFSSSASDLTQHTLPIEATEIPKSRRLALSTLEEAIQEEKKRARAFDQELLCLLQGKTLAGKELEDEFAPLLAAAPSKSRTYLS